MADYTFYTHSQTFTDCPLTQILKIFFSELPDFITLPQYYLLRKVFLKLFFV